MKFSGTTPATFEDRVFLSLLVLVSAAFLWVLSPFYGAVFWGAVFAILFIPLYARLLVALKGRTTAAALLSVVLILVMVILPLALIMASLVREAAAVYERIQTGELNFGRYFQQVFDALPAWVSNLLDRFGMGDVALLQARLTAAIAEGSQFLATQALNIGQNTFNFLISFFVMLYLLFFFLRDSSALTKRIRTAIPLDADAKRKLTAKFTTVIRATVKGNIVVAVVQGILGGIAFWVLDIHAPVLWGTLMAFLSLLPAVGAAIVWLPVAIYFLVTGALWQGVALVLYGVLVIGLVDNILRPILVGKDTKMPDYVVLVSTIGGMALFGLNGFVIGPVIAAMFMSVWDIFAMDRETMDSQHG